MTIERLKEILVQKTVTFSEFQEINDDSNLVKGKGDYWFIRINGEIRDDVWIAFYDYGDIIECKIACEEVRYYFHDVSEWLPYGEDDYFEQPDNDSLYGGTEENEFFDPIEGCWRSPNPWT